VAACAGWTGAPPAEGGGGRRFGRQGRQGIKIWLSVSFINQGRRRWEGKRCSDGGPQPVGGLVQASTRSPALEALINRRTPNKVPLPLTEIDSICLKINSRLYVSIEQISRPTFRLMHVSLSLSQPNRSDGDGPFFSSHDQTKKSPIEENSSAGTQLRLAFLPISRWTQGRSSQ
jgi:hypothetical protein